MADSPHNTHPSRGRRIIEHPWRWILGFFIFAAGAAALAIYDPIGLSLFWIALLSEIAVIAWIGRPDWKAVQSLWQELLDSEPDPRNRRYTPFIVVLCAAAFGGALAAAGSGWLAIVNAKLDRGVESCRIVAVYEKNTGRRSNYGVRVYSWRQDKQFIKLHLEHSAYQSVRSGSRLRVCSRPGAFGVEWISGVSLAH